jgi:21S rRNA (GM2251-2'-O)-methyltransferase
VLRCGKLEFEQLSRIPHPRDDPSAPSVWLVLDEVVDPQNLGALLRSAFFLGGTSAGVLVCSKNSAPPSPVVSAASAGALELMEVYSTSNLPRTLNNARDDGFRIVGASSSVPRSSVSDNGEEEGDLPPLYELQQLPPRGAGQDDKPVLLVLGSEGHGLRTLVAKACSEFVRIPSGEAADEESSNAGVDSLNVSVTGGILLWHLLHGVTQSP